jgi:hypothetical protein
MQPSREYERHTAEPTLLEMQIILQQAEGCLNCRALPCDSGSPCFEFTPGGAEYCSALLFWNGKPILPETLRRWKEIVISYQAVPQLPDKD